MVTNDLTVADVLVCRWQRREIGVDNRRLLVLNEHHVRVIYVLLAIVPDFFNHLGARSVDRVLYRPAAPSKRSRFLATLIESTDLFL